MGDVSLNIKENKNKDNHVLHYNNRRKQIEHMHSNYWANKTNWFELEDQERKCILFFQRKRIWPSSHPRNGHAIIIRVLHAWQPQKARAWSHPRFIQTLSASLEWICHVSVHFSCLISISQATLKENHSCIVCDDQWCFKRHEAPWLGLVFLRDMAWEILHKIIIVSCRSKTRQDMN